MATQRATKRWSREDWVDHALEQLGQRGPSGITLDALCLSAKRTRGSLYHHFEDHAALLAAMIERWREKYTEAVIEQIRDEALRGGHGARRLNTLASALDFAVETGVRRLAATHPHLAGAVAKVDQRRIDFIATLRREAGRPRAAARAEAEIEYAAYVGAQQLTGVLSKSRLSKLYAYFEELTGAAPRSD